MKILPYPAKLVSAAAIYPYSEDLLKQGMRVSRYEDPYQMFRVVGVGPSRRIWVPRNMAPKGSPTDMPEGMVVQFKSSFVARNSEQQRIVDSSTALLKNGESFILESPTGCVDRDTEYLSPTGWKPIGDYTGGRVMQFDPLLGVSSFVTPDEYIKLQAENLWHFKTKYGLEQCLSDDHRVLYKVKHLPNFQVKKFGWVRRQHAMLKYGFPGKILTTFTPQLNTSISLSDDLIRLQVASMADGHFNSDNTNRVTIRLKKPRKIARIRKLLVDSGLPYKERACPSAKGFMVFSFYAPLRDKFFGNYWWDCSLHQLSVIADEVLHWDGNQENQFYTTSKPCADFIQYAFTSTGKRASITLDDRVGDGLHQSISYMVGATDRVWVGMESSSSKTPINEVHTVDGFKYCFSVPSGFLVLRKNNSIFVTGNSGKTACTLQVISQIKRKTIVLVHKEDLRNQWIESAKKFLNLTDKDIGIIQADKFQVSGKKLVIAMIQSLAKEDRYPAATMREFGLMVVDETHHIGADVFSQACFRVPAKLRIGISATPTRKDGREEVVKAHIGPVLVKSVMANMAPRVIVRESPWKIPMTRVTDKDGIASVGPIPHSPGKCGHVINMVAGHHGRNTILAGFIHQAYLKDRRILVQSDRKSHLETLMSLVHSLGVPQPHMSSYVGGMKKKELDKAGKQRIIFSTYTMSGEGTDLPWLDTLVMATPKSDIRQIVGRILRIYEGKQDPVVFDIVDRSSNVFLGYWNNRRSWYAKVGAEVVVKT